MGSDLRGGGEAPGAMTGLMNSARNALSTAPVASASHTNWINSSSSFVSIDW